LEVDELCVDAMVATGAAYANVGMYEQAIIEWKNALKMDPGHKNAAKYLNMTIQKLEQNHQSSQLLDSIPSNPTTPTKVNQKLKLLLENEEQQVSKSKAKSNSLGTSDTVYEYLDEQTKKQKRNQQKKNKQKEKTDKKHKHKRKKEKKRREKQVIKITL